MESPTARSKKKMKDEGWLPAVVERWNQYARVRQDLFGFIDLIAIRADSTLAIQATTGANVSERLKKIREAQAASLWLESPSRRLVIHGWRKVGPRGKRKLWECRELEVTKEMLAQA